MQELEVHLAQPSVTDWVVLLVGYFVISALALAGLWLYLAWKVCLAETQYICHACPFIL